MRARLGTILAAPQGPSDGMGGIAIVIKNQVWTPARTIEPALQFIAILLEGGPDGNLGGGAIGVGRCGGYIAFAIKALAELVIGPAHMFT